MKTSIPASLTRFCRSTLPLLHRQVRGDRMLKQVAAIQKIDRWISFDRFHASARHIAGLYRRAGAGAQITAIPTGGRLGSGRWLIHEASDVRAMTLDVVSPVRQRVADYRDNPFHAVQWTTGSGPGGVEGDLFVLRGPKSLDAIPPGGLAGRIVLSRKPLRDHLAKLADKAPAALIYDISVPGHPDAVSWQKFGWGGIQIEQATRMVGMVISRNQGERLRELHRRRGKVRLRLRADVQRYQGSHDIVCGVVRGGERPGDEVWALAHSIEPGAQDNASGVAACVEIARAIEGLIARGKLKRPRRTIRLLHGYECYSFFHYLENSRSRYGIPVAGVVIDSVGALPRTCRRRLQWCETVESSAAFVNDVGEAILRATLRLGDAGYRYAPRVFMPTSDNLVGDPQYGFPCPWLTTCMKSPKGLYDAYHSSADTTAIMSGPGMKAGAAAMAGYLYFLANLDDGQALDLARSQADEFHAALAVEATPIKRAYLRDRCRQSLEGLKRFVVGPDRLAVLEEIEALQGPAAKGAKPKRRARAGGGRIPRRIAPLTPTAENLPRVMGQRLAATKLNAYALFWADGKRTLREIARRVAAAHGKPVTLKQVTDYFETHAQIGYVEWV